MESKKDHGGSREMGRSGEDRRGSWESGRVTGSEIKGDHRGFKGESEEDQRHLGESCSFKNIGGIKACEDNMESSVVNRDDDEDADDDDGDAFSYPGSIL